MDIRDSQRIKQIRDNTEKMADAFTRIADALERLTEPNSSEKPNNCEVKNYCDDCLYNDVCDNKEFFYACTSKATISKMEQVDKDTNVRSKYDCETCKHDLWHTPRMCGKCVRQEDGKPSMYESKTEPQTECETMSCEECKHYRIGKPCEPFLNELDCKYEPQTDCAWGKGE